MQISSTVIDTSANSGVFHISNDGHNWKKETDINKAMDIADETKSQVFIFNENVQGPDALTLVYSWGERAAFSSKPSTKN